MSDLERANTLQRGNLTDLLSLGLTHFRLGNQPKAEEYLQQVTASQPDHAEARKYLGQIRYERAVQFLTAEDYNQASALFEQYLQDFPQDGEGWFNLGLTHLFLDDLSAAREAFLKSDTFRPGSGETYNRLGYITEKMGNYQAALEYYQKSLSVEPKPEIQKSVRRIQERLRRQKR